MEKRQASLSGPRCHGAALCLSPAHPRLPLRSTRWRKAVRWCRVPVLCRILVPCPGALPHPPVQRRAHCGDRVTGLRSRRFRAHCQVQLPKRPGWLLPSPGGGPGRAPCPLGIGSGFIIMQFWLQRATFSLCMKLQQVDKCLLISNPQRLKVQPLSQKYQPSQA